LAPRRLEAPSSLRCAPVQTAPRRSARSRAPFQATRRRFARSPDASVLARDGAGDARAVLHPLLDAQLLLAARCCRLEPLLAALLVIPVARRHLAGFDHWSAVALAPGLDRPAATVTQWLVHDLLVQP